MDIELRLNDLSKCYPSKLSKKTFSESNLNSYESF